MSLGCSIWWWKNGRFGGLTRVSRTKSLEASVIKKSCAEAAYQKGLIIDINFNSVGIITFEYLVYVSNRHLNAFCYMCFQA